MQPFMLPPVERLRHWKLFRTSLDETSTDKEQLNEIMQYWYQYPVTSRYIDPHTPELWPSPWEMSQENQYCASAMAIMMEQSLLLSNDDRWTPERLSLKYIIDDDAGADGIILVVDDKYVLNYNQDDIINFDILKKICIIQYEYLLTQSNHSII